MKNMTLPAKNSNRSKTGLTTQWSNRLLIAVLTVLTVFAAGCKKEEPETFISNVSRPTWTAPEASDITSSMTAVVKVDLAAQYPETAKDFVLEDNDLLAAFSGETCLGVVQPQEGLFFLYIAGPNDQSPMTNDQLVTLRYYSAHYKNLFEAKDAFPFRNDDHLGTVAEPLIPQFVVAGQDIIVP